ncbi:AzlC family ABC transporter permease [Aerophototrophica crusticola]|uniref:AzlC family ABC transporter permease n=1 Tax=Aerophototrophica crusticola TaxID=1709002 RepID=A0A858R6L0_9PROT|nr:AzlC family ABC transporter permease [Rhodospirillaceae bacterium B3]
MGRDGVPVARGAVIRAALREAFGIPGLVLAASYLGFGSLVRETGFPLWFGLASTATGWALPGQVALVELAALGSSLLVIGMAVGLTNARLMPMTVTLLPSLRRPGVGSWRYYAIAHLIAVTSWANGMRETPRLAQEHRFAWFATFAVSLWTITLVSTAAGFFLAGLVPKPVTLALVFLNPLYFLLLFLLDLRPRSKVLALAFGTVLGPVFHWLGGEWGLLATGLVGGTAAFLVNRALPKERPAPPAPVGEAPDDV